jgi:hypothetical protein
MITFWKSRKRSIFVLGIIKYNKSISKMKNFKKITLAVLVIIGGAVFTGCGPETPTEPKAEISFKAAAGYTSSDGILSGGTEFKIGIQATHTVKLKRMEITVSYDGGADQAPANCLTTCDTSFSTKDFSADFVYLARDKDGTEKWTFTFIDDDNKTHSESLTLETTEAPKPLRFVDIVLGNQSSADGSSLDLSTLSVYTLAQAKAASEKVDMVYVKDDVAGEIFASPSTAIAADKLEGANGVANWATRITSKFRKLSMTQTVFNGMSTTETILKEVKDNGAAVDQITGFSATDIYIVEAGTANGNNIIIRVIQINVDNTVTLKVAVEDI